MLELGDLGVEVCGELSCWRKACRGKGCADLLDFGSCGKFGSEFGRDGHVLEVSEPKASEVQA